MNDTIIECEQSEDEVPHEKIYWGECWFCGKEVYDACMVMESGEIECIEHWDKTVDV